MLDVEGVLWVLGSFYDFIYKTAWTSLDGGQEVDQVESGQFTV